MMINSIKLKAMAGVAAPCVKNAMRLTVIGCNSSPRFGSKMMLTSSSKEIRQLQRALAS